MTSVLFISDSDKFAVQVQILRFHTLQSSISRNTRKKTLTLELDLRRKTGAFPFSLSSGKEIYVVVQPDRERPSFVVQSIMP
ncbi:hypothetical protein TNCV_3982151 [Trichonephila clavipes]|nr:hypothetical protein TNCV_3982151 [Trichonephila clavipes]